MLTFMSTLVAVPAAKAVLLALALGSVDLALSACWSVCLDVGRRNAGVVTGFMNTFSNLGGVLTPMVVAYCVDQWQSWTIPFYVTAVVYAAGALIWLAIDPNKRLDAVGAE
jgi:nitrate/nitrite transporter NarK